MMDLNVQMQQHVDGMAKLMSTHFSVNYIDGQWIVGDLNNRVQILTILIIC